MINELEWNNEILKLFRQPGDFRYQLLVGVQPPFISSCNDIEGQWLVDTGGALTVTGSMFKHNLISQVQNGNWVLDGTMHSMYRDNSVDNLDLSEMLIQPSIPATFFIGSEDPEIPHISDIKLESTNCVLVWNTHTNSYAKAFKVMGVNITGRDNYGRYTYSEVCTTEIKANTSLISEPDISSFKGYTFDMYAVKVLEWSDNTFPTMSNMYFGYTESNATSHKSVLEVQKHSETSLSSNSLTRKNISIRMSNIKQIRDVSKDLLLEASLPGHSVIYAQFGQMYSDKCVRYLPVELYVTSKYSAPTESQEVILEGGDVLSECRDVCKYNVISRLGYKYREDSSGLITEDTNKISLEGILYNLLLSTELPIDPYNWPEDCATTFTSSYGALPKNTPVNQVLQYVAQLLGAVVFADNQGFVKAVKVSDLTKSQLLELRNECQTSWPSIVLDKKINKIEIKQYRVMNQREDLMTTLLDTEFAVTPGIPYVSGGTQTVRPYRVTYDMTDHPIDTEGVLPDQYKWNLEFECPSNDNKDPAKGLSMERDTFKFSTFSFTGHFKNLDTEHSASARLKFKGIPYPTVQKKIEIVPTTNDLIYINLEFDEAIRGGFFRYDSGSLEMVHGIAGAYYTQGVFKPLKLNQSIIVEFVAAPVKVESKTVVFWDDSENTSGESLVIDNPLISSNELVQKVGNFIKSLIAIQKKYKLDYLGDPALNALANRKVFTDYETINNLVVTKSDLTYNGGYNGTIEGRSL